MTLTTVPGISVGHAQVPHGGSGCTVVLGPFRGAVEVRGLATGTRELEVLSPYHLVDQVNAILLSGGSAFGLAAADGVMDWLAEQGLGFDTGTVPVPLVPAAVIFDLAEGVSRPGFQEGRWAAESATDAPVVEGRVGAGSGATVGKLLGPEGVSPGGIGSCSRSWNGGRIGALAVVNALGDVVDARGGVLAGAKGTDGGFSGSDALALGSLGFGAGMPGTNTTLVVLATDLPLSQVDLGRVGKLACGAFSRAITPVNTPFDGDVVFALSTSPNTKPLSPGELLAIGVVARELTEEAIRRAVRSDENPIEPNENSEKSSRR
jgi:L-aminopeptidase/D-esterase-like protein